MISLLQAPTKPGEVWSESRWDHLIEKSNLLISTFYSNSIWSHTVSCRLVHFLIIFLSQNLILKRGSLNSQFFQRSIPTKCTYKCNEFGCHISSNWSGWSFLRICICILIGICMWICNISLKYSCFVSNTTELVNSRGNRCIYAKNRSLGARRALQAFRLCPRVQDNAQQISKHLCQLLLFMSWNSIFDKY